MHWKALLREDSTRLSLSDRKKPMEKGIQARTPNLDQLSASWLLLWKNEGKLGTVALSAKTRGKG